MTDDQTEQNPSGTTGPAPETTAEPEPADDDDAEAGTDAERVEG